MHTTRVAIVTGAARGIGRAVALTLAHKGAIPIIVDIDTQAAEQLVEEISQQTMTAAAYAVDVASVAQITEMVAAVIERFGRVDILVNNAGVLSTASIAQLDENEWDRVMNVNLKSAMFTSQQVLPHMEAQGWGRIVNISSLAGRMGGFSAGCAYSTSKAAMIGMTMCLARQVARNNITVNAVAPGPTETDMVTGFSPDERKKLKDSILVGRLGTPENIAETVAFLTSEAASFITGAVIDVNGGLYMG